MSDNVDLKKKIDLRKAIVSKIVLEKKINNVVAQVVIALDYSGSMEHLYSNGFVQELVERMTPLALQFDDNSEMELYLFESGVKKHKNVITEHTVGGMVSREVYGKYNFGGTNYAPTINKIVEDYVPKKSGFFSSGKEKLKQPVYVIFVTDGDNSDKTEARKAITEASNHGVFFQFVGIGNARMNFLEELDNLSGRTVDNANFFQANDFKNMSDDELYGKMLNEFPSFINEAKTKGVLV